MVESDCHSAFTTVEALALLDVTDSVAMEPGLFPACFRSPLVTTFDPPYACSGSGAILLNVAAQRAGTHVVCGARANNSVWCFRVGRPRRATTRQEADAGWRGRRVRLLTASLPR